jgi:hypothetical protein
MDRLLQESDWWRESRHYLLAVRFHGPVPDSVLDGQWEASTVPFFVPYAFVCTHEAIKSSSVVFNFCEFFRRLHHLLHQLMAHQVQQLNHFLWRIISLQGLRLHRCWLHC